jgi:nitrogen fixation protein NifU and related proteins
MTDIYRDIILDHYKHPRNFGHLPNTDTDADGYNATCGDKIRMEVSLDGTGKQSKITDIRFSGIGCAISQAAASMLTEKVKEMKKSEVLKIKSSDIISMLGSALTPSRVKCATLPLEVLQKALLK